MSSSHFEGKTVPEHLKEARRRGAAASAEVHGAELSGHIAAGADSMKECAVFLLFLTCISTALSWPDKTTLFLILTFSAGLLLWKMGRSSLLGWTRLNRLHQLIEEERWEIQHRREEEKAELKELYSRKGLQGRLLDEVTEALMADENRLLRIMLEEELGVELERIEHPLKQAAGAGLGVLFSAALFAGGFLLHPLYGVFGATIVSFLASSILTSRIERTALLPHLFWALGLVGLSAFATYLLAHNVK